MKRYDIIGGLHERSYTQEHPDGQYVKYDDVRHLLEKDGCRVGELVDVLADDGISWIGPNVLEAIHPSAPKPFLLKWKEGEWSRFHTARPHVPRKITRPADERDVGRMVTVVVECKPEQRLLVAVLPEPFDRPFICKTGYKSWTSHATATVEEDAT